MTSFLTEFPDLDKIAARLADAAEVECQHGNQAACDKLAAAADLVGEWHAHRIAVYGELLTHQVFGDRAREDARFFGSALDSAFPVSLTAEQWLALSHYAAEHQKCVSGEPDCAVAPAIRAVDAAVKEHFDRVLVQIDADMSDHLERGE